MDLLRRLTGLAAAALAVLISVGCTPVTPSTSSSPSVSASIDFTVPGVARSMLADLAKAAGTSRVIMANVSRREASVSIAVDGKVQTWAYRGGTIKQVPTDTWDISQTTFDLSDFDTSDVGALFRLAAAISGSDTDQELQIVEYSGGTVMMTVTTMPESRTVFFNPDATLLPTLDFGTRLGIQRGLADAVGTETDVLAVGVHSVTGAYVDVAGPDKTTIRRQRAPRFPTNVSQRSEDPSLPTFDPATVNADAIWSVLQRARASGYYDYETTWSVVVDRRFQAGSPRMYFKIGDRSLVTDLTGTELSR